MPPFRRRRSRWSVRDRIRWTGWEALRHPFTLDRIDGDPLSLEQLTAEGPAVVVFAHADCPTSTLALRRLASVHAPEGVTLACVAEETPPRAAQLARRTGIRFPVLAEPAPFDVSRAYGVETVPTAVRIEPGAGVTGSVVGWDAERYAALLGTALPAEEPARKPGCGARWTYEAVGGLDELEDMFERGWSDGLPVVPPTPERVEAMLGGADPGALARAGAARARRGDARAARRLRRPRRLPPGLLPGRARGGGGRARAGLQRTRHRRDDPAGRNDPRRQRAGAASCSGSTAAWAPSARARART